MMGRGDMSLARELMADFQKPRVRGGSPGRGGRGGYQGGRVGRESYSTPQSRTTNIGRGGGNGQEARLAPFPPTPPRNAGQGGRKSPGNYPDNPTGTRSRPFDVPVIAPSVNASIAKGVAWLQEGQRMEMKKEKAPPNLGSSSVSAASTPAPAARQQAPMTPASGRTSVSNSSHPLGTGPISSDGPTHYASTSVPRPIPLGVLPTAAPGTHPTARGLLPSADPGPAREPTPIYSPSTADPTPASSMTQGSSPIEIRLQPDQQVMQLVERLTSMTVEDPIDKRVAGATTGAVAGLYGNPANTSVHMCATDLGIAPRNLDIDDPDNVLGAINLMRGGYFPAGDLQRPHQPLSNMSNRDFPSRREEKAKQLVSNGSPGPFRQEGVGKLLECTCASGPRKHQRGLKHSRYASPDDEEFASAGKFTIATEYSLHENPACPRRRQIERDHPGDLGVNPATFAGAENDLIVIHAPVTQPEVRLSQRGGLASSIWA